jgi:hypothetical protein
MRLSRQLTKLLFMASLSLSGCGSFEIADIGPMVTLPASGDCYGRHVVSQDRFRFPKEQCDDIKKHAIIITSEDWKKQRISIQKNCQMSQCKQLIGAFDELFLAVDKGLQQIPLK